MSGSPVRFHAARPPAMWAAAPLPAAKQFPAGASDRFPDPQWKMQAVADAQSLLANILVAWNNARMQQVLHHWPPRRGGAVPRELIGRVAPARTDGINMRSVFRFPVVRFADKGLPSAGAEKTWPGHRESLEHGLDLSICWDQTAPFNQPFAPALPTVPENYARRVPYVTARRMKGPLPGVRVRHLSRSRGWSDDSVFIFDPGVPCHRRIIGYARKPQGSSPRRHGTPNSSTLRARRRRRRRPRSARILRRRRRRTARSASAVSRRRRHQRVLPGISPPSAECDRCCRSYGHAADRPGAKRDAGELSWRQRIQNGRHSDPAS